MDPGRSDRIRASRIPIASGVLLIEAGANMRRRWHRWLPGMLLLVPGLEVQRHLGRDRSDLRCRWNCGRRCRRALPQLRNAPDARRQGLHRERDRIAPRGDASAERRRAAPLSGVPGQGPRILDSSRGGEHGEGIPVLRHGVETHKQRLHHTRSRAEVLAPRDLVSRERFDNHRGGEGRRREVEDLTTVGPAMEEGRLAETAQLVLFRDQVLNGPANDR